MQVCLLTDEYAEAAARVHRASFDERLPWLTGLHTPEQDHAYFRNRVFRNCQVFGALEGDELIGMMAFRQGWIDQLYVMPRSQGQGVGSALLAIAKESQDDLSLWTFQKNIGARKFYERHGFNAVEQTDGRGNDEREPDVRYYWRRSLRT